METCRFFFVHGCGCVDPAPTEVLATYNVAAVFSTEFGRGIVLYKIVYVALALEDGLEAFDFETRTSSPIPDAGPNFS